MTPVHFSSKTYEWETPSHVFGLIPKKYNLVLDVCAKPHNAKFGKYITDLSDALTVPWAKVAAAWGGACWMNPPYGRGIGKWIAKAAAEAKNGAVVVSLLPARTDTRWWHDFCMPILMNKAEDVMFLKGRLKFISEHGKELGPAPFPSVIVIFGSENLHGS